MVTVPSLTGSLYVDDVQSVIAYTLNRFFRTPQHTVPIVPDLIISLPWLVAKFHRDADTLCNNIQSDLQGCFNRIFDAERKITVAVTNALTDASGTYDITISIIYTMLSGEIGQTGATISLKNGRLVIPENNLLTSYL
jgi:hypothetical protein